MCSSKPTVSGQTHPRFFSLNKSTSKTIRATFPDQHFGYVLPKPLIFLIAYVRRILYRPGTQLLNFSGMRLPITLANLLFSEAVPELNYSLVFVVNSAPAAGLDVCR